MKQLLSIFLLLVALCCCTTEADRNRMRAGLDSINQRNRNDQPFTPQDVKPYVQFFDDHGTPNDRLLAHYLLGRAYYEAGEAPMALECYQKALDCADTTATDCDFAQLSRAYAQMGNVFYYQGLYRNQLEYAKLSVLYALKGRDTLAALINYEQEGFAYNGLGIQDSAIIVIEDVARKFEQYGYPADAAISLGTIVSTLVDIGENEKAKLYMKIYESKSGFFRKNGDIEKGREKYYNVKGLYYYKRNLLDSAEYWYRKELNEGKDFNNQNGGAYGLAMVYNQRHVSDSAAKYFLYAYSMNDSMFAHTTTKTIERMQAMNDYSRHQKTANIESQKAALAKKKYLLSLIVLLIISLAASWLYIAREQMIDKLNKISEELNSANEEKENLMLNELANQQFIAEKEKRIDQLEQKLGRYGKLVYFGSKKVENNMLLSPNYQKIKVMAYKGQKLSAEDWIAIKQLIEEYLPGFYDIITSKTEVNTIEYRVCLLLRLHFKAGEVANLLDVTPAYISKISSEYYQKVYNKKGSSKELSKELNKIS